MKHPNWLQWCIIWITVLTAAHIWMGLNLSDLLDDHYGGWGLPAYLRRAFSSAYRHEFAVTILVMGALLMWQVSGRKCVGKKREKQGGEKSEAQK